MTHEMVRLALAVVTRGLTPNLKISLSTQHFQSAQMSAQQFVRSKFIAFHDYPDRLFCSEYRFCE